VLGLIPVCSLFLLAWESGSLDAATKWDLLAKLAAGLMVLAGLVLTAWRIKVSEDGQATERFTRAVDQLGAKSGEQPNLEVRMGAVLALEQIAQEHTRYRSVVFALMAAYVRNNAKDTRDGGPEEPLRLDIHAAVSVIGNRRPGDGVWKIDLRDACLRHAELDDANLSGVVLCGADLTGATLSRANRQGAELSSADLTAAVLHKAVLRDAVMWCTTEIDAVLTEADLRNTKIMGATLDGAVLRGADFSGASIDGEFHTVKGESIDAVTSFDGADFEGTKGLYDYRD
jgi:hypothetical protein